MVIYLEQLSILKLIFVPYLARFRNCSSSSFQVIGYVDFYSSSIFAVTLTKFIEIVSL